MWTSMSVRIYQTADSYNTNTIHVSSTRRRFWRMKKNENTKKKKLVKLVFLTIFFCRNQHYNAMMISVDDGWRRQMSCSAAVVSYSCGIFFCFLIAYGLRIFIYDHSTCCGRLRCATFSAFYFSTCGSHIPIRICVDSDGGCANVQLILQSPTRCWDAIPNAMLMMTMVKEHDSRDERRMTDMQWKIQVSIVRRPTAAKGIINSISWHRLILLIHSDAFSVAATDYPYPLPVVLYYLHLLENWTSFFVLHGRVSSMCKSLVCESVVVFSRDNWTKFPVEDSDGISLLRLRKESNRMESSSGLGRQSSTPLNFMLKYKTQLHFFFV